jgi:hypothetical protein
MRYSLLDHQFVDYIPEVLEPGVLYVSMTYATAAHKCCCGCGLEVVTPFTPTDWRLTFDGEAVSLSPSIGNWNFACRSHYVIDRGRIIEAGPWSDEQVVAERKRDRRAKAYYYGAEPSSPKADVGARRPIPSPQGLLAGDQAMVGRKLRLWARRRITAMAR